MNHRPRNRWIFSALHAVVLASFLSWPWCGAAGPAIAAAPDTAGANAEKPAAGQAAANQAAADNAVAWQRLEIAPARIELFGPRARQRLVVSATGPVGGEAAGLAAGPAAQPARLANASADVTADVSFAIADSQVAVVSGDGVVTPVGDGTTSLIARWRDRSAEARIVVTNMAGPAPIDFRTEVSAALSRAGCSQGACHGSPQGKDGFRLSLRGFDPALDLVTLAREDGGRRVNPQRAEDSLILWKGGGRLPHQGGKRFQPRSAGGPSGTRTPGDAVYETLRQWIAEGAVDQADSPELVALEVLPGSRVLAAGHPRQRLTALAKFSDGSVRDVTPLTVFSTRVDPAVEVSAEGVVEFRGTAEATVLARYLQQVRSVHLTYVDRDPEFVFRGPPPANEIDTHVFERQRRLQLQPAAAASDEVFLRRAYLDVIGTLPTAAESRAFLDSVDPNKREALIEQLLQRPEFGPFWALKWADVMRGNRNTVSQRGVHSLHRYLVKHFAADRPFDQLARELVTGQGNTLHRPPANFFRISPTPEEAAESFAQLFLGVRLQCAKCHNHPFETLTQTDYYGLAAYFARVRIKGKQFGADDEIVIVTRQGEVQHPLTRKNLEPIAFGTPAGSFASDEDRRERLADWLVDPSNRLFARATANRIWRQLMGRGIVEPVDDFRETNPPSHPELLDHLADLFVRSGYRMKPVIREVLRSRTYQLSAARPGTQSPRAADPAAYYTQASIRLLTGEQAVDAVSAAIGVPEEFKGYPPGTRAIELAEGAVDNDFLMAFSRPIRDAACDCAREEDPSLGEVLHLLNNRGIVERIASARSHLGRWLAGNRPTAEILEEMYLATLSRRPTDQERRLAETHVETVGDRAAALADWQHALLNSNEFLLRH